ncbi:LAMI_0E05578g1_1 [Lachancea mirantina]|uniref:LAMI_0E05578g1_1 n=1 Tax=Lachancea mirantina TaxID=1230905 RepID=A0A1G4JLI0_9SACH|nr:LAMI_0E05578g1_1 [Lachancea mirantina]
MASEPRSNALQLKYNEYKHTLEELQSKVIELDNDRQEHEIVLNTLEDINSSRVCYRMIGGSLVETNVEDTRPVLSTKVQNMKSSISKMKAELIRTAGEFEKWKKDNKIQVVRQ